MIHEPPTSMAEYLHMQARHSPMAPDGSADLLCPVCLAPGFLRYGVADQVAALRRPTRCAACGRTMRCDLVFKRRGSTLRERIQWQQVDGDPQPGWLDPPLPLVGPALLRARRQRGVVRSR